MSDWRTALNSPVPIEVGDGWRALVEHFYEAVEPHHCTQIIQVKEKYGLLRMYFDHDYENCIDNDKCAGMLSNLESELAHLSSRMCESCGRYGRARGGGWIKTLCDECHKPIDSG